MRILVLNKKQFTVICAIFMVGLISAFIGGGFLIKVFAKEDKIHPIYSVEMQNKEKMVSLGINCAWGDGDIPQILDSLDKYKVKATFFVVGDWCEKYPQSVKAIFDRGHEIGNHSMNHADMPSLSKEEIKAEIEDCSRIVQNITGIKPSLFRAPSGAYNNEVIKTATELGYYNIQWDCDSLDWKGLTSDEMEQRIMKKLSYGSIMLFHNDTKHTKDALPQIIEKVQSEGYQFVTVGNLIYKDNYVIDHTGRQQAE